MIIQWQEFRYILRGLIKQPGLTAIAVISLALGIGANSAIFSVLNATLLKTMPHREFDRLVMIWGWHQRTSRRYNPVSPPDFLEWKAQNGVFENIAISTDNLVTLTGRGDPEQLPGYRLSANYLDLLGVKPVLGRNFLPEEDRPGGPHVAIINHRLWQRRFAGDSKIIGQSLILNGESYTVVGVTPPGYEDLIRSEVWTPLALTAADYNNKELRMLRLTARLKPGVTLKQAQANMDEIAARQEQEDQKPHEGWRTEVVSLREHYFGDIAPILLALSGAVGFVLLIACANISNLLLSKAAVRRKETAIRAALGASGFRLSLHFIIESVLLALLGGLLALPLAKLCIGLFLDFLRNNTANVRMTRVEEIPIDIRVFGFTFLVSILCGVILGLISALRSSRLDLNDALKEGSKGGNLQTARRTIFGFRTTELTVIAEIALSLVLLAGAGLMLRSFLLLSQVNLGLNPKNVLTMRALLPFNGTPPEKRRAFYQNLLPRLEGLPGIESAAIINTLPLSGWTIPVFFTVEGGSSLPPGETSTAYYRAISPDYLSTMGITLLNGRSFTEHDNEQAPPVVIVNETLARRCFRGVDPIGKRVLTPSARNLPPIAREIVGVIGDVRHDGAEKEVMPEVYVPFLQVPSTLFSLAVRTRSDPMSMADMVRKQVWAVDKDQSVSYVMTMEQMASESIGGKRISALLTGIYAMLALIIASIGIYGVMANAVGQQTREIGIRTALGATTRDIMRLVMWRGTSLIIIGLGLGLAASITLALALTRLTTYLVDSRLLYKVSATDPFTFIGVSVLLAGTAMAACYIPARRAARVDPLNALRDE